MVSWIYWDIQPEIFTIPVVNWPVLWYGLFFATGFAVGFPFFVSLLTRFFSLLPKYHEIAKSQRKKQALLVADSLVIYMVLGTVIGARLGHFLFYEHPSQYLKDPLEFFRIWEGGLASHGGIIGILIAVFLFSLKMRKKHPELSWAKLLDLICIPGSFGGFCIRLGNFFNQEVLGKPTDVPWAVIFGHPADLSRPFPRHAVQLYEGLFYLALFFLLWFLSYRKSFLRKEGWLIGLFLVLMFSFRFFVEYFKVEESYFTSFDLGITMGQMLSIPFLFLGLFFLFFSRKILPK